MYPINRFKISFLILLLCFTIKAQKGNYFIHNYLPSQYQAADQNRCILQDMYGRVFVANNDGFLVNNGSEWDKYSLPFLCLSLGKDENEEIFIAGDGDFGKIIQNENGAFKFESLKKLNKDSIKNLGRFWSIITLKGHVYFCSNQVILDYDYKTVKSILPGEEGFHTFFEVEDKFILREKGVGLKILSATNEFTLLKGGDVFADNSNPVRAIIKGENCHYIVTPQSLYRFNFNKVLPELSTIEKINSPINAWLNEKTVYCAEKIGSSFYAFGSVNGGLLITDENFNPVNQINTGNTLQDDGVNYIYNDNQGHIWLALAKGISLIEFNSPITRFTKSEGVIGTVESCELFNGTAFLATDKGLLQYNPTTLRFETTIIKEAAWCLKSYDNILLAGTNYGLYKYDSKKGFELIYETPSALHSILFNPLNKLIYLGTETGFAKGLLNGNTFTITKENFDIEIDIRTMSSTPDGVLFGTTTNGIYYEKNNADSLIILNEKNGLPNLNENYLFNYSNETLIATDNGIYKISDFSTLKISLDSRFNLINNKYIVARAFNDKNNCIWLTTKLKKDPKAIESLMCLEFKEGNFKLKATQLSRIKESDTKSFCSDESLIYIGTNNGLYCYDLSIKPKSYGLNTFINNLNFGTDTTQYFFNIHPLTKLNTVQLSYNSSIEIRLGASDYIDKNELLFSYYLVGRDTGFSAFSNNKKIILEYLHEGDYTFIVKSKNILGIEGQEIKINFQILPPWYRTWWAYTIYILALIALIYLIIKLNLKRLREQNIKLENIITDRTKEINAQKLLIEHKNREITDSINYAKGIQDSILPSINEIKKVWKELFIFFKPKDIVSGDFYWFKQINADEFLIACADCTGHGVPGGFMSMICSDKLNDATRESTQPDKILYLANNSIKETLRQQSEGKSKDGMEICLIKVNVKTKEVIYAGANRQLWIIEVGDSEVKELKPTKASIASFTEFNFKYEASVLKLKEGDSLYLTSDGYPDQFGGRDGKKYMSKNFKNYLLSINHLPMHQQENMVRENIINWMGDFEQVDDLLVIGIKL
ncbi:MAG: SpoIIE family protein phosphatase [Bacteroidia bacterium]|nr:SpoIIE family protein phosphatase [Bacteroidia bacterium]